MKTETSNKGTNVRHDFPRLRLEELEQRIVPSGLGTAPFAGGDDIGDCADIPIPIKIIPIPVKNLAPIIGDLSIEADTGNGTDELTLSAGKVVDHDGSVTQVQFYRDTNGNGVLDVNADEKLGVGTNVGNNEWRLDGVTLDSDTNENVFFARAQDDDRAWSKVESITAVKLDRNNKVFNFWDATGDSAKVAYHGKGSALVQFDGNQADGSDIESIVIAGTRRNSKLFIESDGSTPVENIEITGKRLGTLNVDGDLNSLDFGSVRAVKNIIVSGTLGDVDASSVKKINLIQADKITGDIDAQRISHLTVSGDMNGATVTAGGSRGKIYDMNVGGDVLNCTFSLARGMGSGYVGGDVVNSIFDAYGGRADIDDLEVEGSFSGAINVGRDLEDLDVGGTLNADITVARDIKALMAGELDDCAVTAGRGVSSAIFNGSIYGAISANEIITVRSYEYFRDSGNLQQDSYLNHLSSVEPLDPSKIYDADGDMND